MALTTNKKNKIIAEWKAGKYKNASQIAKFHKIDYKTARKIISGISQVNAEIVEIVEMAEIAKKSIKNPKEVSVVEKIVRERLSTLEDDEAIIDNNRKIARAVQSKLAKRLKREDDLDYRDAKLISGTTKDLEAIANPRESNINIQQNQQQAQSQEIKTFEIKFV